MPPLLPELSKEVAVVDTNNPEELPEARGVRFGPTGSL